MKQLLVRADDLGYSYAVNVGIARTVHEGIVRSAGLMPNMPEASRGVSWLGDANVALGQHTNVCYGRPCADPGSVPSLLTEDGVFRSSREYREAAARGEDFVEFDEAVAEVEAQLDRFRTLVGRDPDYFEAHAVASENLNRAITYVAEEHGLKEQRLIFGDEHRHIRCGSTMVRLVLRSQEPDYDPSRVIREIVGEMGDGEAVVFVCHPGYLDQEILSASSLTAARTKEVDALIDPETRSWLDAREDLKLVDYRDL